MKLSALAFLLLPFSLSCFAQEEIEFIDRDRNDLEALEPLEKSINDALESKGFLVGLESPELGASASQELNTLTKIIAAEPPLEGVSVGTAGARYDVILQPGHYGRRTGVVGTQGKLVSERALVSYIVGKIAVKLRSSGLTVLVVPADNVTRDDPATPTYDGLSAKIFMSIHADGSEAECKTGPSLAYPQSTSPHAMYAFGWALARALGYQYSDFRKDGFTANAARYYMFDRVKADVLIGLLEIGELTCPQIEERLISSSDRIAANVARAIDFVINE